MDYRTLGRSGCAVSTLTLGTMTFGKETDEQGAHAQLDAFLEAGGNLVDTADVYTAGASEEIIGRWLARPPRRGARPGRARHQGPLPDGRRTSTTSASPAGTCSARWTTRCAASASRLRRPLPGALLGPDDAARGDPGHPRRLRPRRQGALHRAVELHRLAGPEDRRPREGARLGLAR